MGQTPQSVSSKNVLKSFGNAFYDFAMHQDMCGFDQSENIFQYFNICALPTSTNHPKVVEEKDRS